MAADDREITYAATDTLELHVPSEDRVSRIQVSIRGTGWTGDVEPQGRTAGSTQAFAEIGYFNQRTMADVAAGSAPAADADILIDSSGLDVNLVVTVSAGSVVVSWRELIG